MTKRLAQIIGSLLITIASANPLSAQEIVEPSAEPVASIVQEFAIDRSERMTVQVQVNGSTAVPFIVDTGSERTVIANDLAKRLLLES